MNHTWARAASLLGIEGFLFSHPLLGFSQTVYFPLLPPKAGLCIMLECIRSFMARGHQNFRQDDFILFKEYFVEFCE